MAGDGRASNWKIPRASSRFPLADATFYLISLLPKRYRFLAYLAISAICCAAIGWFGHYGWPNFPTSLHHYVDLQSFQIYLFMAAPAAVLIAIVAFLYRNQPDDPEMQK